MTEISSDLPDYLRTPYSQALPKSAKSSRKTFGITLNQGVSEETPDFFKIPRVPVISSINRKDYFDLNDSSRFLSDLKQNNIFITKKFQYCDFHNQNYDYDTVSFANRIDLNADRRPTLKSSGGFYKHYDNCLSKGFGIDRGEFIVERTNPKIVRNHSDKARCLRLILNKTSTKKIIKRTIKTASIKERKHLPAQSKLNTEKEKQTARYLDEIDIFESNLTKKQSSFERRKIYKLKNES